jgi:hypothetical protein
LRSINRHLEALHRLEPTDSSFVRAAELGGEVVAVGPFRAIFSRGAENVWLNQAMPYEPLGGRGARGLAGVGSHSTLANSA